MIVDRHRPSALAGVDQVLVMARGSQGFRAEGRGPAARPCVSPRLTAADAASVSEQRQPHAWSAHARP